jgi:RNA-binding protein
MPKPRVTRPKAAPPRSGSGFRDRQGSAKPVERRLTAAERAAAAAPKIAPPQRPLTTSQKRFLRGYTHALKPLILVGQKGVTPALLQELDGALAFHELVKIKLADDDRESRAQSIEDIREHAKAEVVQTIGKVACLYRYNPERAGFDLPK